MNEYIKMYKQLGKDTRKSIRALRYTDKTKQRLIREAFIDVAHVELQLENHDCDQLICKCGI